MESKQQRVLQTLFRHFCAETESVESKRKQCIFIGSVFFNIGMTIAALLHALALGTFSQMYSLVLMFGLEALVVAHTKWRKGLSQWRCRAYFMACIYVNIHLLATRQAFAVQPHTMLIGLVAPILSMLVSPTASETMFWAILHLFANYAVHGLQVRGMLPAFVISSTAIVWMNALSMLYWTLFYLCAFWYVVQVYTMELSTRQGFLQLFEFLRAHKKGKGLKCVFCLSQDFRKICIFSCACPTKSVRQSQ